MPKHHDSDLPVSLQRRLRQQRRWRLAWRRTANGFLLLGLFLLGMAFCNFYGGDSHSIGSTWSWLGWFSIGVGVLVHFIRGFFPNGDPDSVSDKEIAEHEEAN